MLPYTREKLCKLNSQTEEDIRLKQIDKCVYNIYNSVIRTATIQNKTIFEHWVPIIKNNKDNHTLTLEPFYEKNMPDIIEKLKVLFPDSNVHYKVLSRGQDGNMYDTTDIDNRIQPFINRERDQAYIIVDWSP